MSSIKESLERLLTHHRIVIWYDEEKLYLQEWNELGLVEVETYVVDNNEFELKYKMLIEKPQRRFVLYAPYSRPTDEENWLLDIELSHRVFHSDPSAMVLEELGLPVDMHRGWISDHLAFFKSKKRKFRLISLISIDDTREDIIRKMVQVILDGDQDDWKHLLMLIAGLFRSGKWEEAFRSLKNFGLDRAIYRAWGQSFNYESSDPGIKDFILKAFMQSMPSLRKEGQAGPLNEQARLWIEQWKDSRSFEEDYSWFSNEVSELLDIKKHLSQLEIEDLIGMDLFEAGEKIIIQRLIKKVLDNSISIDRIRSIKARRQTTFWFSNYEQFYTCILMAAHLIHASKQEVKFDGVEIWFDWYSRSGYKVDQAYRRFVHSYRQTGHSIVLHELASHVDKLYTNGWLEVQSRKWQAQLDQSEGWYTSGSSQKNFFDHDLKADIQKGRKLFVIISDALRYECGQQLNEELIKENRYQSTINYRVTSLPSYTQLGMAALLPNKDLEIRKDEEVWVDGMSSKGTENRSKILKANSGVRAIAIQADEIMRWNSRGTEAKELVQGHDLIYIYHNGIDKVGDDKMSEERLTDAVEEELLFIKGLIKKLTNMNANNLLVTADHGFLYQNESVAETDYSMDAPIGKELTYSRRYAIGKNLEEKDSMTIYSSEELGLLFGQTIGIPRGLMRFRKKGSGSRYVHGGSSLQEIMIPVLKIEKKRKDTIEKVEVDLLSKSSNRITTHSMSVRLYQGQAVDEYWQQRTLRIFFVLKNDLIRKPISDVWTQVFNSSSDRAEEREYKHGFRIATEQKRGDVQLILEEQIDGTEEWKEISAYEFSLILAMDNDFD